MIEGNQNYHKQESVILSGAEVCILPQSMLQTYAEQISAELRMHRGTMIQYTPRQIITAMHNGLSVVAYDLDSAELNGFAQIWQYAPGLIELGSWISKKKGIGKKVLEAGIELNQKVNPETQTIAIVAEKNRIPQICIEKSGGILIGTKTSEQVSDPNSLQPAQMKIYKLS